MGSYTKDMTMAASLTSAAVLLCTAPVLGQASNAGQNVEPKTLGDEITPETLAGLYDGMSKEEVIKAEIERIIALKTEMAANQPRQTRRNRAAAQGVLRGGGPSGDDCNDPIPVDFETGGENSSTSWSGNTCAATHLLNEQCPFTTIGAPDLVYVWTADADGNVDLNLCAGATDYDSKLYVYEAPPGGDPSICGINTGAAHACNDDACTSTAGQPFVSLITNMPVTEGNVYYIVVDGWDAGDCGNFFMQMDYIAPPTGPVPNTCETAADIFEAGGVDPGEFPLTIIGDTCLGTDNYNEICPYTLLGAPDLVYSWTPALPPGEETFISIDLCSGPTNYDSKIYVYANVCTSPNSVACSDDACTSTAGQPFVSRLTDVPIVGGNTYFIVVDGWSAADCGVFHMTVSETPPPPPDPDCERNSGGAAAPYAVPAERTGGIYRTSDTGFNILQYGRFEPANALGVTRVRWWGAEVVRNVGGIPAPVTNCLNEDRTFNITFYNDLLGAPGAVQCEFLDVEVEVTQTGLFPLAGIPTLELIQYDYVLPATCNTLGGWVGIHGNSPTPPGFDTECGFLWVTGRTNPGGNGGIQVINGVSTSFPQLYTMCANGVALNPGSFVGACCSNVFPGSCGDGVSGTDCTNTLGGEFFPFLECDEIECFVPQGACCTGDTGDEATEFLCLGVMSLAACNDAAALLDPPVTPEWLSNSSCIACPAPPLPNDNCEDAISLTAGESIFGNTFGATSQTGETGSTCVAAPDAASVWYTFTAPDNGTATFDTCGSFFDTTIAAYSECPGPAGTELACNDDFCGLQSSITVDVTVGQTVLVRVAGWNNAQGFFVLNTEFSNTGACCLSGTSCIDTDADDCAAQGGSFRGGAVCVTSQCNDRCETAVDVVGDLQAGVSITAANALATADGLAGNAPCAFAGLGGQRGVWFQFTAPCDGLVDIVHAFTISNSSDSEMQLYDITTDGCPTAGDTSNLVGCGGDENCVGAGGLSACIEGAPVEAGRTYALRVAGWNNDTINAEIDITVHDCAGGPPPCPGDANGDNVVDVDDLIMVIQNWGSAGPNGDVNNDGIVDVADLILVIQNWGSSCP